MRPLSKGDIMRLLDMTTGVDSALPHQFIQKLSEEHGIDSADVLGNFVMDYRNSNWQGTLTPITLAGLDVLDQINNALGWDVPKPCKVVDPWTGLVWEACKNV